MLKSVLGTWHTRCVTIEEKTDALGLVFLMTVIFPDGFLIFQQVPPKS